MDDPVCSVIGLSMCQMLVHNVDVRRWEATCVWSCDSQQWCTGRARGHTEQVACSAGNTLILCLVVGIMQSDIQQCHHGAMLKNHRWRRHNTMTMHTALHACTAWKQNAPVTVTMEVKA